MRKPLKLSLGIGIAGLIVAGLAVSVPQPYAFFAAWTTFACVLVSGAYLANFPGIYGKHQGRLRGAVVLILFPYLSMFWSACWLMRTWRKTPSLDQVAPGVYVGGRLRGEAELPRDTVLIVDLTSEFTEPRELREHPGYRGVPVMDGASPRDERGFMDLLDEISKSEGNVVFHCDAGRGRAPTAAALALLWMGMAKDPDEAVARVVEGRPCASPTRSDLEFIRRVFTARKAAAEGPIPAVDHRS